MHSRNSDSFAPTCTVVICTHNRTEQLERCLAALASVVYPEFDVLVVDNAPSDHRTRDIAESWHAGYLIEPMKGLSRARNRGARSCETEIVAFLDDDALPDPAWLDKLISEFADPRVMVVTGRILPLRIETRAEKDCALMDGFSDERRAVDRDTASWFELANFGGLGDGGNMAFRRRAFEIWPGFDERLGRGAVLEECEEHHAFFSLLDRGYRVVYNPDAIVHHPYPRTMQDLQKRQLKLNAASTAYITLLFVEEPDHRRRMLKYVREGLTGTPRPWRKQCEPARASMSRKLAMLFARLCGPLLYAWSPIERRLRAKSRAHEPSELDTPFRDGRKVCNVVESSSIVGECSFRE